MRTIVKQPIIGTVFEEFKTQEEAMHFFLKNLEKDVYFRDGLTWYKGHLTGFSIFKNPFQVEWYSPEGNPSGNTKWVDYKFIASVEEYEKFKSVL